MLLDSIPYFTCAFFFLLGWSLGAKDDSCLPALSKKSVSKGRNTAHGFANFSKLITLNLPSVWPLVSTSMLTIEFVTFFFLLEIQAECVDFDTKVSIRAA